MRDFNTIDELDIFDFDGTLVDTPLPETGRAIFEKMTGNPWPHKGWWSQPDSLNMEVFAMPSNSDVIADFHLAKANTKAGVILLTGRLTRLGNHVKAICEAKGLEFDEFHFNTGGSTDVVKMKTMDNLLAQFPNIKIVKMWEDRLNHVQVFEQWGKEKVQSGKLNDFIINVVINENRDGLH